MLRRILIPVDFSSASAEALAIARQYCPGGTKRLLHVLDPKTLASDTANPRLSPIHAKDIRREAEEAGFEKLRRWALDSDEVALAVGNAAEAILKHAEEWNADMIVIGTRGRRGIANFLSGSATEWLVRHAKLPVLVVHDVPLDAETACRLPPQ
ncbi:universal stress protein [Ectothiorhodospiraceae bacterium 2226]|nr:universal stress protein [Ectothiorhodospiraceae bacterium 2226]